jgi:hypothetical protein
MLLHCRLKEEHSSSGLQEEENSFQFFTVKSLYPILGSQLILMCLPFLYFYLKDSPRRSSSLCHEQPHAVVELREVNSAEGGDHLQLRQRVALLALMACLYFFFSGMEATFRSYISTFTVAVGNSRQTGSGRLLQAQQLFHPGVFVQNKS